MSKLVVNLYGSPTCMPCNVLKKVFGANPDIVFNYYNALEYPELGIKSTPHMVLVKDDEKVYEGHPSSPAEARKIVNNLI